MHIHNSKHTNNICVKYIFAKKCVYICVFHIYFVLLQQILKDMNERERIEKLIKSMNLSARQFAEQIRVQPGTISNMMAGRNNPSLEVMKRIMQRYPTVNPEWLIAGQGEMWRTVPGQEAGLFDNQPPTDGLAPAVKHGKDEEQPVVQVAPTKKISRIVVYYTDNTFEEFSN